MICSKELTITVVPAALFSWPAANVDPGDGSASFSPSEADGNTAIALADIPDPPGGINPASASNLGELAWNSTSIVPANLRLEVVSVGDGIDPTIVWDSDINVVDTSTNLVTANQGTHGLNTVVDIPFNLPNTSGADWTITWLVVVVVAPNLTNGGSISVTATVSLV